MRSVLITGTSSGFGLVATLELARESLMKGAFDFIAKPFKLGEIRKTIDKAVAALDSEEEPALDDGGA